MSSSIGSLHADGNGKIGHCGHERERIRFREIRVPYEHLYLGGRRFQSPQLYRSSPKAMQNSQVQAERAEKVPADNDGAGSGSSAAEEPGVKRSWIEVYRAPAVKSRRIPLHEYCKTQAEASDDTWLSWT